MLIVLLTFIISLTAVVILIKNTWQVRFYYRDAMVIVVAYPIVFIVVWCIISARVNQACPSWYQPILPFMDGSFHS